MSFLHHHLERGTRTSFTRWCDPPGGKHRQGMRWLAKFKGTIKCAEKSVALTAPSGNIIEVRVSMSPSSEGTVYHVSIGQ